MNRYVMIVLFTAFAGLAGCFGDESGWIVENQEALKAKDFKTDIVLSINVNPSATTKTVFEDTEMMIEVVSIIADAVDITATKSGYDVEVNHRNLVTAVPNQRARLKLVYYKKFDVWTLYLVPYGSSVNAISYDIPGKAHQIVIAYRLLAPDLSKSEVMTAVVHIR